MSASLGKALVAAWSAAGAARRRVRRPARGWHAQLSELTRSQKGQAALGAAGVNPGPRARNWRAWLAEDRTPSSANRARIEGAYSRWFGGREVAATIRTPLGDIENRVHAIYGRVVIGDDDRERGSGAYAPFRVDGATGDWYRLRDAWMRRANAATIGRLFIEDIIGSDPNFQIGYDPVFPPEDQPPEISSVHRVELER